METHSEQDALEQGSRRRRRRPAAPMDAAWLLREGMLYLGRWEASRMGVRDVLARKICRRAPRTGQDVEPLLEEIPGVVEKLVAQGFLDDRRFATQLHGRLRREGRSRAEVRGRLRTKGVDRDLIDELLAEESDSSERRAAWKLARRKRLGPFCLDPERRERERDRQLRMLARHGYGAAIAWEIIRASEVPDLEE